MEKNKLASDNLKKKFREDMSVFEFHTLMFKQCVAVQAVYLRQNKKFHTFKLQKQYVHFKKQTPFVLDVLEECIQDFDFFLLEHPTLFESNSEIIAKLFSMKARFF